MDALITYSQMFKKRSFSYLIAEIKHHDQP